MKPKKQRQQKGLDQIRIPDKRKTLNTSSRTTLTRRKDDKSNKENNPRATQSLEKHTFPSKELAFQDMPQKSITNKTTKLGLQEISQNNNDFQRSTFYTKSKEKCTEQQLCQRRLSLKCTNNYSQQLQRQQSQRYSMIPLRKQNSATLSYNNAREQRDSLCTYYDQSIATVQSKPKSFLKKQAIITNLMTKLDHQEDLRSIIESKLKTGSNSSNSFAKDRKNQGFSDFNDENSCNMNLKLRQCQNELSHFRSVIRELSQKIIQLTPQQKSARKSGKQEAQDIDNSDYILKNDLASLMKLLNQNNSCQNCLKQSKKVVRQIGIQTLPLQSNSNKPPKRHQQNDFFDNIQRTLKVLSKK